VRMFIGVSTHMCCTVFIKKLMNPLSSCHVCLHVLQRIANKTGLILNYLMTLCMLSFVCVTAHGCYYDDKLVQLRRGAANILVHELWI
jgi:hypothetical protein